MLDLQHWSKFYKGDSVKPNIEVSIEGKSVDVEFVPNVYQQNNEIFVHLKDSEEYEEKLNNQITLYKDVKTNEIIGLKIQHLDIVWMNKTKHNG